MVWPVVRATYSASGMWISVCRLIILVREKHGDEEEQQTLGHVVWSNYKGGLYLRLWYVCCLYVCLYVGEDAVNPKDCTVAAVATVVVVKKDVRGRVLLVDGGQNVCIVLGIALSTSPLDL